MAVDVRDLELKLIRRADGVEVAVPALQGLWTAEQYLRLTDQTNHLIEFTDGQRGDLQAVLASRLQKLLLNFGTSELHLVGGGAQADLHPVQTDLSGYFKGRRIPHLADGPIARADFEAALLRVGEKRRTGSDPGEHGRNLTRAAKHDAPGNLTVSFHFDAVEVIWRSGTRAIPS